MNSLLLLLDPIAIDSKTLIFNLSAHQHINPSAHQLIWLLLFLYAVFNTALVVTWLRIKPFQALGRPADTFLSVIIVVRNEADNIVHLLEDLNQQTYPSGQFEVIIADDSSTDGTFELVEAFVAQANYRLTIFHLLTDASTLSPKKKGITQAINLAQGEVIVTTDGDCRVNRNWLMLIAESYRSQRAKLISGAVTFERESSLLEKMQTVEFASLIGSGACALQWGFPTMCNGANLAYSKAAFLEVGGFAGVDHLASGDDELLMHKIAHRYPNQLFFIKNPSSVVRTCAQPTLRALYQQRKRWASKWNAYKDWKVSLLAVFIFLSNFCLLLAAGLTWAGGYPFWAFILQVLVKFAAESLPLALFLIYLQKPRQAFHRIMLIPLVQLIYPFYVAFFGLAAQKKGFEWKGRKMN